MTYNSALLRDQEHTPSTQSQLRNLGPSDARDTRGSTYNYYTSTLTTMPRNCTSRKLQCTNSSPKCRHIPMVWS